MPGEPLWWKPSYIFFQEDLQPALDTALSHKIKRNVQTWHTSSVQQKLKYISHECCHSNMWETLKEVNMMNRYNLYFSKILPHTSLINHPAWVCVRVVQLSIHYLYCSNSQNKCWKKKALHQLSITICSVIEIYKLRSKTKKADSSFMVLMCICKGAPARGELKTCSSWSLGEQIFPKLLS